MIMSIIIIMMMKMIVIIIVITLNNVCFAFCLLLLKIRSETDKCTVCN